MLALLVVIGAISVPLMEGTFSRASLHSGGDLVRAAWARARLAAMQSGQTHVFRFELNGSRFQILPLANLGLPEANDLQPADPEERYDPSDMLLAVRNRLPEDVTFVAGDVATSSHVTATQPDLGQSPWSPPVLFHPDGTTSDAWIVLANEHDRRIRVTLRGLTGVSNVSEILEGAPR